VRGRAASGAIVSPAAGKSSAASSREDRQHLRVLDLVVDRRERIHRRLAAATSSAAAASGPCGRAAASSFDCAACAAAVSASSSAQVGSVLPQGIELALALTGFLLVARRKRLARIDRGHETPQRLDGAGKHRQRRLPTRVDLRQRDQRELERLRQRGNRVEAAGAMDTAQRVCRADHRRRGLRSRVELQEREIVVE